MPHKLYIGGQYMKNWRNASGWNLDSIKTTVDGVAYTDAADRKYSIDAWNTIIGFRYHPDAHWRFVLDYVSLFGHHKMADSQKLKASRQNINGAIEYKITKRTMTSIHSSTRSAVATQYPEGQHLGFSRRSAALVLIDHLTIL